MLHDDITIAGKLALQASNQLSGEMGGAEQKFEPYICRCLNVGLAALCLALVLACDDMLLIYLNTCARYATCNKVAVASGRGCRLSG